MRADLLSTLCVLLLTTSCGYHYVGGDPEDDGDENGSSGGEVAEAECDEDDFDCEEDDDFLAVESETKKGAIEIFGGLTGPEEPWDEMSYEDKEYYMVGKVYPIMKEIFSKQDGARWGDEKYQCESCHGKDMKELKFKMPSQTLYVVAPEGTKKYKTMEKIFPDMVKFMKDEINPAMGKLMGKDDFTCAGCHPTS